jgi:glycosyltransferase involved in cell wall biosynthesis
MLDVSIVIPTLEEEGWIADTISQFKALSLSHEVIVSDGRSQDGTVAIAQALVNQVCVMMKGKPSAARQRNDGARLAAGRYLAFVDCGVQIQNCDAFFKRAIAYFENDIELVAVVGPQRIAPETETLVDRVFSGIQNSVIRLQNNLIGRGAGSGKFILVRRAAFEQIGGFREKLITGEDLDLALRLAKVGKTRFIWDLAIAHAGRREHKLGWLRLIGIWTINVWWIWLFDRAYAKEWRPIR